MGRRKKTLFDESLVKNACAWQLYVTMIQQIALSSFQWEGLPDTISERDIETELFCNGSALWFYDDTIGYLCLPATPSSDFDVYGVPYRSIAYSKYNTYHKSCERTDSVLLYDNQMRIKPYPTCEYYAQRLWNLDRVIDVNANAQKTPVLVRSTDRQRLTLQQVYQKWSGNEPVIFADTALDPESLTVFRTDAPYVADKLYELKSNLWNECLTYLGIANVITTKKERMIKDEVLKYQGGVYANRFSRLAAREEAARQINAMFDLDVHVRFRDNAETFWPKEGV